jgi:NAD+ synthase
MDGGTGTTGASGLPDFAHPAAGGDPGAGDAPGADGTHDGPAAGGAAADPARLADHLTGWLRDEVSAGGGAGVVFGLSGGIDSAVVAALALRAYPETSLGVLMPCHSDPRDAADAHLVADAFGLPTEMVDLGPVHDLLLDTLAAARPDMRDDRLAGANLKPRLRMMTLYAFANRLGYRVLGTGNLSELTIGYFTKYGDGGVDLLPLGALVKSEVRELARHLGVPQPVIDKPPSAGLWAGQTDEGEMGLTYDELDAYLLGRGADPATAARIESMRAASAHKRALPKIAPKPTAE